MPEHVRIVARTRDWLRYEVPDHFIRRDARGHYKGQKQIWFLLQLIGHDSDMNLRATDHPEFDAWRWNEYWVPLDVVIEFKRDVYQMALTELARFLPRATTTTATCAPACGRTIGKNARSVPPHGAAPLRRTIDPRRRSSRRRALRPAHAAPTSAATRSLAPTQPHDNTKLSRWIISGSAT